LNLNTKISVPSQVMARQVGAETVILDLASGTYYGLDAVGARVWQLMVEGQTFAQACKVLLAEYDVQPEQLQQDIAALVQSLADQKLVTLEA
jgi:Coenzyme PQQ synthesis protein D (PqqD)